MVAIGYSCVSMHQIVSLIDSNKETTISLKKCMCVGGITYILKNY